MLVVWLDKDDTVPVTSPVTLPVTLPIILAVTVLNDTSSLVPTDWPIDIVPLFNVTPVPAYKLPQTLSLVKYKLEPSVKLLVVWLDKDDTVPVTSPVTLPVTLPIILSFISHAALIELYVILCTSPETLALIPPVFDIESTFTSIKLSSIIKVCLCIASILPAIFIEPWTVKSLVIVILLAVKQPLIFALLAVKQPLIFALLALKQPFIFALLLIWTLFPSICPEIFALDAVKLATVKQPLIFALLLIWRLFPSICPAIFAPVALIQPLIFALFTVKQPVIFALFTVKQPLIFALVALKQPLIFALLLIWTLFPSICPEIFALVAIKLGTVKQPLIFALLVIWRLFPSICPAIIASVALIQPLIFALFTVKQPVIFAFNTVKQPLIFALFALKLGTVKHPLIFALGALKQPVIDALFALKQPLIFAVFAVKLGAFKQPCIIAWLLILRTPPSICPVIFALVALKQPLIVAVFELNPLSTCRLLVLIIPEITALSAIKQLVILARITDKQPLITALLEVIILELILTRFPNNPVILPLIVGTVIVFVYWAFDTISWIFPVCLNLWLLNTISLAVSITFPWGYFVLSLSKIIFPPSKDIEDLPLLNSIVLLLSKNSKSPLIIISWYSDGTVGSLKAVELTYKLKPSEELTTPTMLILLLSDNILEFSLLLIFSFTIGVATLML